MVSLVAFALLEALLAVRCRLLYSRLACRSHPARFFFACACCFRQLASALASFCASDSGFERFVVLLSRLVVDDAETMSPDPKIVRVAGTTPSTGFAG
jgi:hypothetical protein